MLPRIYNTFSLNTPKFKYTSLGGIAMVRPGKQSYFTGAEAYASYTFNIGNNRLTSPTHPVTWYNVKTNRPAVTVSMLSDSVTGDTKIFWKEDEYIKFGTIEDLFCRYTSMEEKDKKLFQVLSLIRNPYSSVWCKKPVISSDNAVPHFVDIGDVVYHGIKPVWKVTLRNGKTIEITQDHSLFGARVNSNELKAQTLFNLKMVASVDDYGFDCRQLDIDMNILTLLGLWIADGSYTHTKNFSPNQENFRTDRYLTGIRISTGFNEGINEWLSSFILVYSDGKKQKLYSNSKGDVNLNSRKLALQFYELFGDVDTYTKRVPKELFTASNRQIAVFLKGYFSGDGSIHIHSKNDPTYVVDCSSVNRELLEDISVLLDRLGIKHVISEGYKSETNGYPTEHLAYKLTIRTELAVRKFVETVGMIKDFEYKSRKVYQRNKKKRYTSLRQIRKVEYVGEKPVYDISVPQTELFVVNGIAGHNTGADYSTLNDKFAPQLGINIREGQKVTVAGTGGVVENAYYIHPIPFQIGNLKPVLGLVAIGSGGGTDVLGRTQALNHFELTYNKRQLKYTELNQAQSNIGQARWRGRI